VEASHKGSLVGVDAMHGVGAGPWSLVLLARHVLVLAALPLLALVSLIAREVRAAPAAGPLADAPRTYEAEPLETDAAEGVERYTFRVRPGATLWDIATEALPRTALEEGPARALELVEAAFKQTYPERSANDVRLDDAFVLEVPAGTFVTASLVSADRGRTIEYTSFQGDRLIEYRADPAVIYRLVPAAEPWRVRVLLRAGTSLPAVEVARRAYETATPDFLQVRTIRAVLSETPPVIYVDTRHPYLDQFRNYRDRAVAVEPQEDGLQLYRFDPADEEVPFLAVEDAIGDEWDAANFPAVARREFYRDGTVKQYFLTQPGDILSLLSRPDNRRWATLLPDWTAWTEGEPERLPPFAPAVTEAGALLPGRLLVLVHRPRRVERAGTGVECLGIPLGLAITAGLAGWWRQRRAPAPWWGRARDA